MVVQELNQSTVLTVWPPSSSESCCAVVERKMQSVNETINCEISLHVVIDTFGLFYCIFARETQVTLGTFCQFPDS